MPSNACPAAFPPKIPPSSKTRSELESLSCLAPFGLAVHMTEIFPHDSPARPASPTSNTQHPRAAVPEILSSESRMTVHSH